MTTAESEAYADTRVTLGCFEVAGRIYAMDVAQVREVVRWQPVTPLPRAPELIEGVIDLRGHVIPVIDLGRALGVEPVGDDQSSRVAIAEIDGLVVGFVVNAATEVLAVDANVLEDPPALATQAGYDMTRAVVRRANADPIPVLSLEHILERVYRTPLEHRETTA